MSVHFKVAGAWTEIDRPYVKRGNAWVPTKEVWVKRSGSWVRAYEYDVTPPPSPQISLQNIYTRYGKNNNQSGNFIRLTVNIPGPHRPDVRMIRVLSTYNGKQPTTQFGGTYVSAPDDNWPNEKWSDWEFDGVKDTSTPRNKTWPRSAKDQTTLKAGTYYFSGWTLDDAGNWSIGTHAQINVPKSNLVIPQVKKETRFVPSYAGSYRAGVFAGGQLIQQGSPRSRGILQYNNQMNAAIGSQGTPEIINAQLLLIRDNNDGGVANANIYLGYHDTVGVDFPDGGAQNVVKLGTLSKGESKWFDLPNSFNGPLNNGAKGFVLLEKDPAKAAAGTSDFSVLKSLAESPRQGELHVIWTESLL